MNRHPLRPLALALAALVLPAHAATTSWHVGEEKDDQGRLIAYYLEKRMTQSSGASTASRVYPNLDFVYERVYKGWSMHWSLRQFVQHENNPDIACASAVLLNRRDAAPDEAPVISSYQVNCTRDGGLTWEYINSAHRDGLWASPLPVDYEQDWLGRNFNRLTDAPEGGDKLALTAYHRTVRVPELQMLDERPAPAACEGRPDDCADTLLNQFPPVWWDPSQAGQGLTLIPMGKQVWGYHTAYGPDGEAQWTLIHFPLEVVSDAMGTVTLRRHDGSSEGAPPSLFRYQGPSPASPWDVAQVEGRPIPDSAAGDSLAIRIFGPTLIHVSGRDLPRMELIPFR